MLDISDRLPAPLVTLLDTIHEVATGCGIPYFIVGATARDLILRYGYDQLLRRATKDLDIAVRVADWPEYDRLVAMLVSTGRCSLTRIHHRLVYEDMYPVDIVPFGPIADEHHRIVWPSPEETVMEVLGFEEAFRSVISVRVRRDPHLDVPVCTLAGLAVIKLLSWDEAYPGRRRDAQDLYYIIDNYIDAGNDDRLYGEASDLTKTEPFDRAIAGARLLGRDMNVLAGVAARQRITGILERESEPSGDLRLIVDLIGTNLNLQERFAEVLELLKGVRSGFLDYQ